MSVIYERTNPNTASTFSNVAAALDRTLNRQHSKISDISKDVGSLLNTAAGYLDERDRANSLNSNVTELEQELAELRKEEAELMSELNALNTNEIEQQQDNVNVDQATDYFYLA